MEFKRVNINLSSNLIKKIDAYAEQLGINRTSAISVLLATQLQQMETVKVISDSVNMLNNKEEYKL